MKKYTFEMTLIEGSDEFWDDVNSDPDYSNDKVLEFIEHILEQYGFDRKYDFHVEHKVTIDSNGQLLLQF